MPTTISPPSGYGALLKRYLFEKAERAPKKPLGPFWADAAALAAPVPADALRATWLGHSSMLLEIDDRRFLTDPVWSERVSPSQLVGPKRFFAPPLPLHWGTFNLAFHAWRQPVQRLHEATASEVPLLLPAPGQRVDVAAGSLNSRWWEH